MIVAQLDPSSPHAKELASIRLRAAEAGSRRDAQENWDSFFLRARDAKPEHRTEQQTAALGDR